MIRATIAEPVEPMVETVFGNLQRKLAGSRARHEWRLIPIGFRGAMRRVLVVYLPRNRWSMRKLERANG